MRRYIRGAYEALSWVRALIRQKSDLTLDEMCVRTLDEMLKKVDEALEDINECTALDFRWRLKAITKT